VKVRLDRSRCVGHGRCYVLAPDVYQDDERGNCVVLWEEVPSHLAEQARRGAENCPEQALLIEPD
jgi:ferredoxin